MITIERLQAGASKFIETEITAQFSGWQKLMAETAVGIYMAQLPGQLEALSKNPIFAGMGLVKDGKIDIDLLYQEMAKHFKEPVQVKIPMLGTASFTRQNLDTLYQMIVNG